MSTKRWSGGVRGGLIGAVSVACLAGAAQASPYLTVSLVGSVHGSGDPFASQVFVHAGDTVDYQVQIQLAPQGTTNQFATRPTITRWVPSNGATSPTAGMNSVDFSLTQAATAGTIQTDFTTGVTGTTTGGGTWGISLGSSTGDFVDRGNGNHNLQKVILLRETGNQDGIANDLSPELLSVATGSFAIASTGTSTTLDVSYQGFTTNLITAALRWRDAANTANEAYFMTVQAYNNSVAGNDPIAILNPLTISPAGITPEPVSLAALAMAVAPAVFVRRRRR